MCFQLSVSAEVDLYGSYYNEHVSEWEPLIEPVADEGGQTSRNWELALEARNARILSIIHRFNFLGIGDSIVAV